jgi:hypothetical protein
MQAVDERSVVALAAVTLEDVAASTSMAAVAPRRILHHRPFQPSVL